MLDWFAKALTPTGRGVLLTFPLGILLAAVSGWREFFVLGAGSLLAIVIGLIWIARPQRLGVTRTLHPPKVTVGESSTGIVRVTNTTRRRIGERLAEDVLGDQVVRLSLPSLSANESLEQPYVVRPPKRGLFDVGPVRLTRADPLGLFRVVQGQGTVEQLWVRPRVRSMAAISSGWAKDLDGPTSDVAPRGSAAFHALREYQFGDDLRHIHWRTSARRSQLMVRHYVDTRRSEELLMLDPRAEVYAEGAFEEAVEIAASICASSQAAGREIRLVLPSQPAKAKDLRLVALDRLALVRPVAEVSLTEAFSEVRQLHGGASALIVVTGEADASGLIQQARSLQRTGLVIVVRVVPGSDPAFSASSGGRVVTVPTAEAAPAVWLEAAANR